MIRILIVRMMIGKKNLAELHIPSELIDGGQQPGYWIRKMNQDDAWG
jgi:hypothetical protein